MKQVTLTTLAWLVLGYPAYAASFDCSKAQTKVEKLICTDAELSKMDEELAAAYTAALKTEAQVASIRQAQKLWMKERNVCADAACVKNAYLTRQSLLTKSDKQPDAKTYAQPSLQQGAKARYGHCVDVGHRGCETGMFAKTGKGYAVCETYLKHLNVLKEIPKCEAPIPPGFKQPEWEELEITSHLQFAYQAEAIKFSGWGGYKQPDFEIWRQQLLSEMQAGKAAPQLRKTTVKPFGDKSIIVLAYTRDKTGCKNEVWRQNSHWGSNGYVHFLMTDDRQKPVHEILRRVSRTQSELLLFAGKPYFVLRSFSDAEIEIIAFDLEMTDTSAQVATMNAYYAKFGVSQPIDTTKKYDPDPNVYWAGQLCHFLPVKPSKH